MIEQLLGWLDSKRDGVDWQKKVRADFKDIAELETLDPYSLHPTTKEDAGVPGS